MYLSIWYIQVKTLICEWQWLGFDWKWCWCDVKSKAKETISTCKYVFNCLFIYIGMHFISLYVSFGKSKCLDCIGRMALWPLCKCWKAWLANECRQQTPCMVKDMQGLSIDVWCLYVVNASSCLKLKFSWDWDNYLCSWA